MKRILTILSVLIFYATSASAQIEKSDTSRILKDFLSVPHCNIVPKSFNCIVSTHFGNEYFRPENSALIFGYPTNTALKIFNNYSQQCSIELLFRKIKTAFVANWAMSLMNYQTKLPLSVYLHPQQSATENHQLVSFEVSFDCYRNIISYKKIDFRLGAGYFHELFNSFYLEQNGLKFLASLEYEFGKRKKFALSGIFEKRFPTSVISRYKNHNNSTFPVVAKDYKYPFYFFIGVKYKLF